MSMAFGGDGGERGGGRGAERKQGFFSEPFPLYRDGNNGYGTHRNGRTETSYGQREHGKHVWNNGKGKISAGWGDWNGEKGKPRISLLL